MPTTWSQGDYPSMAQRLVPAAELVVARAQIASGDRVLDVACGTGNAALLAAQRGAQVSGIDIEPELLTIAGRRATEARVRVHWHRGDAEALDAADGEFDAVLSVFGVMYAAAQDTAAGELARVCAPYGRVVLASWTPGSFMPKLGGVLGPYLPPPPEGSAPPSRWGDEESLHALLADAGLSVEQSARETLAMTFGSRTEAAGFLIETAGHVVAERRRLQTEGRWADLQADVSVLVAEEDRGRSGSPVLELEYLVTVARPARAA
jgi:SAM-dependent methyltransferase